MKRLTTAHLARLAPAALLVLAAPILASCGDDGTTSNVQKVQEEVEKVTGDNDVELKGNSRLDAAGYAIVAAQSGKYDDYEIDGDTVRLFVKDDVELSGSECVIVSAATSTDYPDATFLIVDGDEEIAC